MVSDTLDRYASNEDAAEHCEILPARVHGLPALIYPASLPLEYPRLMEYLSRLAQSAAYQTVQERRKVAKKVDKNQREEFAPIVSLGMSMLFEGKGWCGKVVRPSDPHVLQDSSESLLSVVELVRTAATTRTLGSYSTCSGVSILLSEGRSKQLIDRYDYTDSEGRDFTFFEGKNLHALCYECGGQLVVDMLVGGGPLAGPRVWGPLKRMAREPLSFYMLSGRGEADAYGVVRSTYYLDLCDPATTPPLMSTI